MTGAPGTPWLWALPFLLTFVGGVFADAYEGPRGRMALAAGGAIVLLQAMLCIISLPGIVSVTQISAFTRVCFSRTLATRRRIGAIPSPKSR